MKLVLLFILETNWISLVKKVEQFNLQLGSMYDSHGLRKTEQNIKSVASILVYKLAVLLI
jgi:hypothetical protein